MAQERFKRKLAAIFSADVAGYSRLMGEDEAATVKTLSTYREIMTTLIQQHRGRVVDSPGDNLLAEFASIVDAVQSGVSVQKELQARNAELPENRRMEFRIGINLGDVIEEGDRIYGDGVNVAARLEALSDPGGICVSKTAFDQIESKLPLGYEYLGDQTVKNIAKPVGAYRVLMEPRVTVAGEPEKEKLPKMRRKTIIVGAVAFLMVVVVGIWQFYMRRPSVEPASVEKMAYPLPDKPSIAVLPFDNLSGDPNQDYLCDGLTEEIITVLSKISDLFVIARHSAFTFKGKPVKVKQVAEELGVRYVLEGSVRKAEERVRVTAHLIDALRGDHLWSERYDRAMEDIFALQDEITKNIMTALQVKLTEGEKASVWSRGTDNLNAYQKFLKGRAHFLRFNINDNVVSRQLFEEAIALDPEFSSAYVDLAWTYLMDMHFGVSKSPKESLGRATQLAQRAISLDESSSFTQSGLGFIFMLKRQYEEAIAQGEKAVALSPNDSLAQAHLGRTLAFSGRYEEALTFLEKAIRLDPIPLPWYKFVVAICYQHMGRHEEAVEIFKKALQHNPNAIATHIRITASYSLLGRKEDASVSTAEVLRLNPKFSIESIAKTWPYKNKVDSDLIMNALRKAGLPDKPPLPLPDKPSIAVLPFTNMSDDPKQEYFADGMTDVLITDLSKISGLFVIARNSVFTYKEKPVKLKQIGRELGVRYVLEGSVRKAKNEVRINAQLIDATTGGHLWAERYDGKMNDVFALQDKITQKIVTALAVKLTVGEQVVQERTDNVAAYDAFLQGWTHYVRRTPADFSKALEYFKRAVEKDPHYGRAYAALASIYCESTYRLWQSNLGVKWGEARYLAEEYLEKAMKYPTPLAHQVASRMNIDWQEYEIAIAEADRAIAFDPNDPNSYLAMAYALIYAGRAEEAVNYVKRAMRLDPQYPAYYLFVMGLAHFGMDKLEEAVTFFKRALERNPENYVSLIPLSAAYAHLGGGEKAKAAIVELKKALPEATVSLFMECPLWRYKNRIDKRRLLDGLRKAGLEQHRNRIFWP